jgi:hypothetical protein
VSKVPQQDTLSLREEEKENPRKDILKGYLWPPDYRIRLNDEQLKP